MQKYYGRHESKIGVGTVELAGKVLYLAGPLVLRFQTRYSIGALTWTNSNKAATKAEESSKLIFHVTLKRGVTLVKQ